VLHTLLDPKLRAKPGEPDLVIVRVLARGKKDGLRAELLLDLIDRFDEKTGFTAMERTTGWDGSIAAILCALGQVDRGAIPKELAIPGPRYAEELHRRGFSLTETLTTTRTRAPAPARVDRQQENDRRPGRAGE
jgi:lysine 6-dehydrogenase